MRPRPRFDTVGTKTSVLGLSRLTYRLVAPVAGSVTWASYPGIDGSWRVARNGSTFSSQYLDDTLAAVSPNGALGLSVANSSFGEARTLTLTRGASPAGVAAFPNPAPKTGSVFFSSPATGSTATLSVVSESGKRVATLTADVSGSFWTWNLRDAQNRVVPGGVYYYGVPGETPQTLLVLP
jgi:hypothetical protein